MRPLAQLAAVGLLAVGILAPVTGEARSGPSPDEIIKSLTPTGTSGATRGLRLGPAAQGQAEPAASQPAISLTVQFATGSADLTPQAIDVLDSLGHWHHAFPARVESLIDGFFATHSDARPELLAYARSARCGCVL